MEGVFFSDFRGNFQFDMSLLSPVAVTEQQPIHAISSQEDEAMQHICPHTSSAHSARQQNEARPQQD